MKDTLLHTWVPRFRRKGIPVYFYKGSNDSIPSIHNYDISVPSPDSLTHVAQKTVAAFNYFNSLSTSYDFIFRTNLSTFLFLDDFISIARSLYDLGTDYAGYIGTASPPIAPASFLARIYRKLSTKQRISTQTLSFCSGAAVFLSQRSFQAISDYSFSGHWTEISDDTLFGHILSSKGIIPTPLPRCDLFDANGYSYHKCTPTELLQQSLLACPLSFRVKTQAGWSQRTHFNTFLERQIMFSMNNYTSSSDYFNSNLFPPSTTLES